jgi:hypothetical protein
VKTAAVLAALIVLGWAMFGFSQATTHPTTQAATPATMPSVKEARAALDSATLALKQAQAAAELRLQTVPAYQTILAAVDAASAKRDAVKESDTASPQDKVDAASAVGDPGVVTATNAVTAATANLKAAQAADALIQAQSADDAARKAKKVVMAAKDYKALPGGSINGHKQLDSVDIGSIGYVNTVEMYKIVDGTTAIGTVHIGSDRIGYADKQIMIEGISTAGQSDAAGSWWYMFRWLKIVGTQSYGGTTYPLAEEIVQGQ